MVEKIIYVLLCIISYSVGAYQSRKAYTLGLKHNIEVKNNIAPKEELNPAEKIINHIHSFQEVKQQEKQEKETKSIMDEWLNGE